uniref:Cytochrome b6-f complex subunit PetP n=1 Tax=Leptosiphonia brodiei TaxID=2608611 RepID=A0A1Z1MAE2_9FLOR|nr:cytochrome b6-f complex subunit PetP [Leptosiphonia brodiei]ARW62929.1 cytochrome b6-f complex subunit PetP [Leptosiphonia brodiei]
MQIKILPSRTKKIMMLNQQTRITIKGTKKISDTEGIVIIELISKYRMWILKTEI